MPSLGVETIDSLHQAERRDLDEIVVGLAALVEAAGHGAGNPRVVDDDLVAQGRIVALAQLAKPRAQLVIVRGGLWARHRHPWATLAP